VWLFEKFLTTVPSLVLSVYPVYEKRPLTSSRKPGYSSTRSTRQLVAMIHQHMNERSRNSKTSSRLVDMKHPLRALMKADEGQKGFLTCDELRESLDRNWVVRFSSLLHLSRLFSLPSFLYSTPSFFPAISSLSPLVSGTQRPAPRRREVPGGNGHRAHVSCVSMQIYFFDVCQSRYT